MERTQVLELMSTLKLYRIRSAYDEVMGNGIRRQHEPSRVVGDLLQLDRRETGPVHSLPAQNCQAAIGKRHRLRRHAVNEILVRELATGTFVADQRNVALVGGTGPDKSHLKRVAFIRPHTQQP